MCNNTSHLAKVTEMYDFYDGVKQWAFYIIYGNNICDTVHCSHATWNLFVNVFYLPLKSQGVLVGR